MLMLILLLATLAFLLLAIQCCWSGAYMSRSRASAIMWIIV